MKRTICIFVSVVMLLSLSCLLSGCQSDTDDITGSWVADVDYAEALNAGISSVEGAVLMKDYLKVDRFVLTTTFTFTENGTYTITYDEDSIANAIQSMKNDFKKGLNRYFADQIRSLGLKMTVAEYLATQRLTLDSLINSIFTRQVTDELVSGIADKTTGNYLAKDGKLFLTTDTEDEIREDSYDIYELKDNTLILMECHCKPDESLEEDMEEIIKEATDSIYPIILQRETY